MKFLDQEINPIGMGCWPIGGAMYAGDTSLGYTKSDDDESLRTIHAALAHGITLFDTAAAYGAGHAERLLGEALADRPEAQIITKIGVAVDEATRQLTFGDTSPERVIPAIDDCRRRLRRETIDVVLLHVNTLPIDEARPIFDRMEAAREAGAIRAYGWSTDFSDRAAAFADRDGFKAIEHAMNVFVAPPRIQRTAREHGLTALIRSPLAMGLLSGKYDRTAKMDADDIRATDRMLAGYYKDGRPNPEFLDRLDAIRALLTPGGRALVQGALGWCLATGDNVVPVPGARTVAQIEGIAGTLAHGPLPQDVMEEIEKLIPRESEDAPEREI